MIDRKTMMWDFLKTIINSPVDTSGMVFVACSDAATAYEDFTALSKEAKEQPSKINNNTIRFGKTLFNRCDKFFMHSGETRNAIYGSDVTGKTAPCFTCLTTETISLITNSSENKPMHALILSLKRSPMDNSDKEIGRGERYTAQQVWLARCSAIEIISLYSANMLKYGIMAECVWIQHQLARTASEDTEDAAGNYEMLYGTSGDTIGPKS